MKLEISRFRTEAEWARGIVAQWQDRLLANPSLRHCLPAGLTPVRVYAEMSRRARNGEVSFSRATVHLLDEYGGLDPDDPGRCANMLRRFFLDHVDLPPGHFHAPAVDEEPLAELCRAYDDSITDGFDLAMLGIGVNGHVGMNEPGTPIGATTHLATLHPDTILASARYLTHDRFPTWGVTVGLRSLLQAKEVWLLARGKSKANTVARLVAEEPHVDLPVSWFRDHPNCRLFLDTEAARAIQGADSTSE